MAFPRIYANQSPDPNYTGPVDSGNSLLNAILRAQKAQQRVQEQNQADKDNGFDVPWWAQRRLGSFSGMDAGSQIIEGQNEIADTGQDTAMTFKGPSKPHNSYSLLGLQRTLQKKREDDLHDWSLGNG